MPVAQLLVDFKASATQCDNLIANAHKTDAAGAMLFPAIDQQQITTAAFLNLFISWEQFLESSLSEFMVGAPTVSGNLPIKYVSPANPVAARALVMGVMRYFDYGNHDHMRKMAAIYFDQGYPYEPHLSAIFSELQDLRTMRNWSAHISSNTQTALESLAGRIFSHPRPGITLYQLLMANDPQSAGNTVFASYKVKLILAAELIAQG